MNISPVYMWRVGWWEVKTGQVMHKGCVLFGKQFGVFVRAAYRKDPRIGKGGVSERAKRLLVEYGRI